MMEDNSEYSELLGKDDRFYENYKTIITNPEDFKDKTDD